MAGKGKPGRRKIIDSYSFSKDFIDDLIDVLMRGVHDFSIIVLDDLESVFEETINEFYSDYNIGFKKRVYYIPIGLPPITCKYLFYAGHTPGGFQYLRARKKYLKRYWGRSRALYYASARYGKEASFDQKAITISRNNNIITSDIVLDVNPKRMPKTHRADNEWIWSRSYYRGIHGFSPADHKKWYNKIRGKYEDYQVVRHEEEKQFLNDKRKFFVNPQIIPPVMRPTPHNRMQHKVKMYRESLGKKFSDFVTDNYLIPMLKQKDYGIHKI